MASIEEFLELERHCSARPDDRFARRRMLQLFFALGAPEALPGSSWRLTETDAPFRVAVLTPYYREALATIERCHRSVRKQTASCEHILVADGYARAELDRWPVRHLRLAVPSCNFGDTPRRVAGEAARDAGFQAVAYLDADNWLRPRHVESLIARHLTTGAPVCTSARTLHRLDGSLMPLFQNTDNIDHVDTNCLFVAAGAFDLLSLWGTWPRELSCIDDRMFWQAARARGHRHAFTGALTTAYEASHAGFYHAIREMPPAGVRDDLDIPGMVAWYKASSYDTRAELDTRLGFPIAALMDDLIGSCGP